MYENVFKCIEMCVNLWKCMGMYRIVLFFENLIFGKYWYAIDSIYITITNTINKLKNFIILQYMLSSSASQLIIVPKRPNIPDKNPELPFFAIY